MYRGCLDTQVGNRTKGAIRLFGHFYSREMHEVALRQLTLGTGRTEKEENTKWILQRKTSSKT